MTHFLYCPFTGLGLYQGYRGDTWLKNRIKIFKNFVVPSLLNQTNRNFILWISWRPEEKTNPIVQAFKEFFELLDLKVVFTYEGVCFFDDKYSEEEGDKRLSISLTNTLPLLKEYVTEDVLMTIQPSDDIYFLDAIEVIQKWASRNEGCYIFTQGYIMNYNNLRIAEYNPTTNPPFYTIKFPQHIFLNPEKHFHYTGPYKSHEYVKDYLPVSYNIKRLFIVGTHGENISTNYDHDFKGREIYGHERDSIFISAGIYFSEPLKIKKDLYRKLMKKLLNILPLTWQRKIICRLSTNQVEAAIKNYNYFNL